MLAVREGIHVPPVACFGTYGTPDPEPSPLRKRIEAEMAATR
jgi:predicted pyridoxine 5'-phosphate oxidase superfamily flavin-nucleotide-binding protein